MYFAPLWLQSLNRLRKSPGLSEASHRVRRRRNTIGCAEFLEARVLLASPAANIDAKLIAGSLFLNGLTAGTRNVTLSQNSLNPALLDVTPGVGTTINGSTSAVQFPLAQLKRDVVFNLNDGLGGTGASHVEWIGWGQTLPGSLIVNFSGNGADSLWVEDSIFGGSVLVTTGDGSDSVSLAGVNVSGVTNINTGLGADTVEIFHNTFRGPFTVEGGLGGGDTLDIGSSIFQSAFTVNMWKSGNTIRVEDHGFATVSATLQGVTPLNGINGILGTTFNGPAAFNYLGVARPGGGGTIDLGRQLQTHPTLGLQSQPSLTSQQFIDRTVTFNSTSTFLAAHVTTALSEVEFTRFRPNFIFCTRGAVDITTLALPDWTVNQPYSEFVTTHGGIGPLVFSVSSGILPTGLTLNAATGLLSGTPIEPGLFSFAVKALDSNGSFDTQSYLVNINVAVSITTTTLANWTRDLSGYSQTVEVKGGTGPKTFSVSAGTLPDGLNLDTFTGVISGTPTTTQVATFTIQAIDSVGSLDTQEFTVTIAAPITLSPETLPDGSLELLYSETIVATGGTGARKFSISFGALPSGLTLNETTGLLSGTPQQFGTFTFEVLATDDVGATGSRTYELNIKDIG